MLEDPRYHTPSTPYRLLSESFGVKGPGEHGRYTQVDDHKDQARQEGLVDPSFRGSGQEGPRQVDETFGRVVRANEMSKGCPGGPAIFLQGEQMTMAIRLHA